MSLPEVVLVCEATDVDQQHLALPFDSDAQVLAAWRWLVLAGRIRLDWHPDGDAPDGVHEHLHRLGRRGRLTSGADPALIRRAVSEDGLWGCEASVQVIALVDPVGSS